MKLMKIWKTLGIIEIFHVMKRSYWLDSFILHIIFLIPPQKIGGEMTSQEFHNAEMKTFWRIQKEAFSSKDYDKLKMLEIFRDEEDIMHVKLKFCIDKTSRIFSHL